MGYLFIAEGTFGVRIRPLLYYMYKVMGVSAHEVIPHIFPASGMSGTARHRARRMHTSRDVNKICGTSTVQASRESSSRSSVLLVYVQHVSS